MDYYKLRGATELTLRGIVLGVLITLIFTAANVYLGLKVGLTFATSIPAAVISMAILSVFRNTTILENNIVQTVASSAGTLSAIIFVLPGLIIIGWWTGFPYWESFLICASGGILGVLFTIPLRRALVTHSSLPYPEGVAAAEVLKVGSAERESGSTEAKEGLIAIIYGTLASSGLAILSATQLASAEIARFFRFGSGASGYNYAFSLALFGAGHLVGLSVGMAMLVGLIIAWGGAVPILTALHPSPDQALDAFVMGVWKHQVRFIGAGCIAVAAIWTLIRLAKPVFGGLKDTIAASRTRSSGNGDERDTDMSSISIVSIAVLCLAVIAWLCFDFAGSGAVANDALSLTLTALPFILFGGFVIAAICGYMAGLIGASNSPISSVCILAIVASATLFAVTTHTTEENQLSLIAFALFATAIICAVSTISNDNLQDLKTGQLVGAAPWRQQIALIIGVIAGAAVIPPVLNLLAQAYGFTGQAILPAGMKGLPAPQANLISALAVGVISHQLDWQMIGIGGTIGLLVIALDEFMGAQKWLRLPPLGVGMAIYLPMSAVLPVVVGAVAGHWYNKHAQRTANPARSERLGVLVASGFIVGESMFGVILAALIVTLNSDAPLGLVPGDFAWAEPIGLVVFVALIVLLYGWMVKRARIA